MVRALATLPVLCLIPILVSVVGAVGELRAATNTDPAVYAYAAQRVLAGDVPYRDIWDHKPPLIYYLNAAALALFGPSFASIRVANMAVTATSTAMLFAWIASAYGRAAGLIAVTLYALAVTHPVLTVGGNRPEALMHCVTIPALWLSVRHTRSGGRGLAGPLGVGLLLSLAALFKQTASAYLIAAAATLVATAFVSIGRLRAAFGPLIALLAGFIGPWVIVGTIFAAIGAGRDFLEQVALFNLEYAAAADMSSRDRNLMASLGVATGPLLPLWVLGVFGAYAALRSRRRNALVFVLWLGLDLGTIAASGRYFTYYFLQPLPALVLLAGWALDKLFRAVRLFSDQRGGALLVAWIGISLSALAGVPVLQAAGPALASGLSLTRDISAGRSLSVQDPYVAPVVAAVQLHTGPGDRIYVFGVAPQIYVLSGRPSASRFVYLSPTIGRYGGVQQVNPRAELATRRRTELETELTRRAPALVAVERVFARFLDVFPSLTSLLERAYDRVPIGSQDWDVYVRGRALDRLPGA